MARIVVLHNVTSVQKLVDFVKVAYVLGDSNIQVVLSKVGGTAAQAGIPEVSKLAYKLGRNLIVLSDLKDVIELFKPEKVYFVTSISENGKNPLRGHEDNIALVFNGLESTFPKTELALGEEIGIGVKGEISPSNLLSIILYCSK